MNNDTVRQLLARITRLEDQVSRLVSRELLDVEEWTAWTPELYGSTTAGTITYTQQAGFYFRIDNMVFVYGRLQVNALTVAPTGNLRIRTLPYAPLTSANNPPVTVQSNCNLTAGYSVLTGNLLNSVAEISLTEMGDDVLQNYPAGNLAANDTIRFSGFYRANI